MPFYRNSSTSFTPVSAKWLVVLVAAADAGVNFRINSGQRTMAQQWRLYNAYLGGSGVLAAYPSLRAPHIRTPNHAIDVDSWNDGENKLQAWLRSEGVTARNTVATESWHLELTDEGLDKLYARYRSTADYPDKARRWIREYDRLGRAPRRTWTMLKRRMVLKRAMKELRKTYWGKPRYAKVYASLLKRSR